MVDFQRIIRIFGKNKLAVVSFYFIMFLILVAIFGPLISPYSPGDIDYSLMGVPHPPSMKHLMGTDGNGRDILSRVLYGARYTLMVGIGAVLVFITIGTILGAVSGYVGGWIDTIIMRIVDVLLSLPILFFILIIQMLLESSIYNVILVIGLTGWAGTCRLVRGQVLSIREMTYIESARAIGASSSRIIFRHVIPNTMAPIIVMATLGVASTILLESALSFLGYGVQEPNASWGGMLNKAQAFMSIAPWTVFFPGILIVLTVLAFNFMGDGLRDALDPKLKT
ncbi:MAG: ABC transporter permease [Candidatus Eremiobacteraeota bacterium]|nr:ABC transporter permease [Candidatus Eremiobacteraeota bacterium]